ncbi:MAG TPA: alpha/beta hydrolase, partial [Ornithinibacter sp.]|nr:alpha/beta hydrolase [Ornithinibacter sp.]
MIDVVERDGLALDVRDEGPRRGEPVILLHGFPQDSRCWAEVTPTLHRAGLRTLAPDQRGYSPGASPQDVSAYRVSGLAADALAVMDAAGLSSAHVVGHDWGGAVAWYLGAHHADRVDSLTVISTPHPSAFA